MSLFSVNGRVKKLKLWM